MPGVISARWTEIRKPGIYRGKRGRECARAQQAVPIVIIAKTKREYREWIGAKNIVTKDAAAPDKRKLKEPVNLSHRFREISASRGNN